MKLLLDTHVFLWAADGDPQLPASVRAMLEDTGNQILVSSVSIWEIVIKAEAGRQLQWKSSEDINGLETWVRRMGAEILPIAAQHALGLWALRDWDHKDPFDRMLTAQAIAEQATLVTADLELQNRTGLKWVWAAPQT